MSLANNKRNVFTTIGSFNSMQQQGNLPNLRNTFSSVNNKNEPIPFLLDILKVVKGSNALVELTGELFTNFIDIVKPQVKNVIRNQTIQSNAADQLPPQFRSNGDGYNIPAKDIDLFGKLKTNPNSVNGSLLYADGIETFDKKAYNAVSNPGTFVQHNNMQIRYNENSDTFTVKSISNDGTIGAWTNDFICDTEFIDKKEVITSALDLIYGTVTVSQGKSEQEILGELKINSILSKLMTDEENLTLSNDELIELENRSRSLHSGVLIHDFGCGLMGVTLDLDSFSNTINNTYTSSDPFAVGNEINNTIGTAFNGEGEEIFNKNQETVRDGFFHRLISAIYLILIKSTSLTPQARILMGIVTAFQNNGIATLNADFNVDVQNMRGFYKCIIRELMKMLNEFIYTLIISVLIALLKPIARQIIREKINSFIGVVKSLISSRL